MKLSRQFYLQSDVVDLSKQLLGKVLCSYVNRQMTSGMIVETEAYGGITDRASHAFDGRRTHRTEIMYASGGLAYVYLCYGIHHLFNVVTNKKNVPEAVLIRAVEPLDGIKVMLKRRKKNKMLPALTAGPGVMSQALGIKTKYSSEDLRGDLIWIEDRGICVKEKEIIASPRVGVDYAGEDAKRPWRFRIKGSRWTSPAK